MPSKTLIIVAVTVALLIGSFFVGARHGSNKVIATQAKVIKEAVANAREQEQAKQRKVNETLQEQAESLAAVNAGLTDDIQRLHNRPDRRHVSENPKPECKGTTGRELSRPDSEFLTRLAARADYLRAALKACYSYADTVGGIK